MDLADIFDDDDADILSPPCLAALIAGCLVKRYLFLDGVLPTLVPPPQCPPFIWTLTDQMTTNIRRFVVPQDLNPNPTPPSNVPEAWSDYVESARQRIFAEGVDREKAMVFIDWCCKLVARVDRTEVLTTYQLDGPCPYRSILQTFATYIEEDVFPLLPLNNPFAPARRPFTPLQTNADGSRASR